LIGVSTDEYLEERSIGTRSRLLRIPCNPAIVPFLWPVGEGGLVPFERKVARIEVTFWGMDPEKRLSPPCPAWWGVPQ
jgi:hypothetical protein